MSGELTERLAADITSGKLQPGARPPTEQELIAATGVSRTVVREAVAALRAEGLVMTRQGVGAFVAGNPRRPFRIHFDRLGSLREVLQVMELRTGIEIEAAGLAAERATPADLARSAAASRRSSAAIRAARPAVDQDFALHCRIAEAAGNPQFVRFLEYLGRFIIPRQTIPGDAGYRRSAPTSDGSSGSTTRSSGPYAPARFDRRGPRCAATCSTAASAIRSSRPSSAK